MNIIVKCVSGTVKRLVKIKSFQKLMNPTREEDVARLNRLIQTNLSTMALHQQTFSPFKGIHAGRDIAIIATGPSLKSYKPIPGCINIGVNSAFKSGIALDYVFVQDYYSVKALLPELNQYRKGQCTKFYGLSVEWFDPDWQNYVIPESDAIAAGALRYRLDSAPVEDFKCEFAYDLSHVPMGNFQSTVFAAVQFAVWTNPKRIYLVGCDCANNGHFDSSDKIEIQAKARAFDLQVFDKIMMGWREFKKFSSRYYPATEIVSINPVGLKGLFKDVYQENDEGENVELAK